MHPGARQGAALRIGGNGARSDAEAASRLRDEFLSIISHELRTPLNAVLGWSAMLEKTGVDTALARRAVRSIQENAARQAKLVDDLLDVSRIVAGSATLDLEEIQPGEIVSAVVESLLPVAVSAGVDLRLSCIDSALLLGSPPAGAVFFHVIGKALRRDVLDAGFHLHLAKPIESRELARAVKELIAGAERTRNYGVLRDYSPS